MNAVFKNRQLKGKNRISVSICCVWSVLLYWCDAWTISESMEEAFNQLKFELTLHINFTDRVFNEEVLRRAVEMPDDGYKEKTPAVLGTCGEI